MMARRCEPRLGILIQGMIRNLGFEHRRDAERILQVLGERLGQFDLALHPDKTRLIEFGRFAETDRRARGLGRPETFDFLGFTHYCRKTRSGWFGLGRKPAAKRVRRALRRIAEVLRRCMHHDLHEVARWLGRVVNGWLTYYAVPTSSRYLRGFTFILKRIWLKTLRRRSQRDRFSWERLQELVDQYWPNPVIRHPWPIQRFDVKYPRSEPDDLTTTSGSVRGALGNQRPYRDLNKSGWCPVQ